MLDLVFLGYALAIWRRYSDALAKRTFAYSIFYLAMLFAALMIDHYLPLASRVRPARFLAASALCALLLATAGCDKLFAPSKTPFHGVDVTGMEAGG